MLILFFHGFLILMVYDKLIPTSWSPQVDPLKFTGTNKVEGLYMNMFYPKPVTHDTSTA